MRPLESVTLEAIIDLLSTTLGLIPDARQANRVDYSLHDTLMSGFAMLFFQHASLLEFQRKRKQRRGRCNLETLFGVYEVPSDTQRQEILERGDRLYQRCLATTSRRALWHTLRTAMRMILVTAWSDFLLIYLDEASPSP